MPAYHLYPVLTNIKEHVHLKLRMDSSDIYFVSDRIRQRVYVGVVTIVFQFIPGMRKFFNKIIHIYFIVSQVFKKAKDLRNLQT